MKKIESGSEWTVTDIDEMYVAIQKIAIEKFGLNVYTNQLEIITSEQMIDAYTSNGLPNMYNHWSFGADYTKQMEQYQRGEMGLAYEIVINSNPCLAYLMEENTQLMQALVIAHASFGHNHFFANNYLFKQWTQADDIREYISYSKGYIAACEEQYGSDRVEEILDAAHSIQMYGVDKFDRPIPLTAAEEKAKLTDRKDWTQKNLNKVWDTIPTNNSPTEADRGSQDRFPAQPEENLLRFIEENAPKLKPWEREVIRIVRLISQYFYPQRQTQLMNEGFASFMHYNIINEMQAQGMISDGAMLEFYTSHTNVLLQPTFDQRHYSGINPYSLGFDIYTDIKRVSMDPTEEDIEWFRGQDWVGKGTWMETIKWAAGNFKDESFIQQFLSPTVMRKYRLFAIIDDDSDTQLEVSCIHNTAGYKKVREALAEQYNFSSKVPDIQVTSVDVWGDRSLTLTHFATNRRVLHNQTAIETLEHIDTLWGGFGVKLNSQDSESQEIMSSISSKGGVNTTNDFDIFMLT